ncbi:hypothetical protein WDZ92_20485 [Nostoc sp. NIES-2111]
MQYENEPVRTKVAAYGLWFRLLGIGYAILIIWIFGLASSDTGEKIVAILWSRYSWLGRAAILGSYLTVPIFLLEVFLEKVEFRENELIHRDRFGREKTYRYRDVKRIDCFAGQSLKLEFNNSERLTIHAALMDPINARNLIKGNSRREQSQRDLRKDC